jgi:hypothetical protein
MMVVRVSGARAGAAEAAVLENNGYAAEQVADRMLFKFNEWAKEVFDASEKPELRRLLEEDDQPGLQQFLQETHKATNAPPFESWYLLKGEEGELVACTPEKTDILGKKFNFRDYFRGAVQHTDQQGRDSVYVSKAFRSWTDGRYRICFARALRDKPNGSILGVIEGSITTDKDMGLLQVHDKRHKAVLVGPEDPNPPPGVLRLASGEQYLILLHEDYDHGKEPIPIDMEPLGGFPKPSSANQLSSSDLASWDPRQRMNANYRDPVPGCAGRWLAGSAPVGNTGYVVIVQQRYEDAIPSDQGMIWSGAAVFLGVVFIVVLGWFGTQWFTRSGK